MVLALDFGATNMRAALIQGKSVKEKKVVKTPKTKKEIISALLDLIDSYGKQKTICIGVASFIRNGLTKNTPNMDFADVQVDKLIGKHTRSKVYVDNDAKCAGLSEIVYGHGKKYRNYMVMTLGTGIGGAIVFDKKLYRGSGYAGEPGQMFVGQTKLKYLAAGSAAPQRALHYSLIELEKVATGKAVEFRKHDYDLHPMNGFEIKALADKGDKRALSLYKDMGHDLGIGLLNIAFLVDPEVFIMGGGFSNVHYVLDEAQRVLKSMDTIDRGIKILHVKLGDDAGLVGASLLEKYPAY